MTSPDPSIRTAALLLRTKHVFDAYVVLPGRAALDALCLYVLHTYAIAAAWASPYLILTSPERQAGKTRALEVLSVLVRAPWHTVSTTEAALFRRVERDLPTLLLDETDAIFGSTTDRTEPLRALLNAGNRRGATATRVVGKGKDMDVHDFSVFCPKVLAGIDSGRLPETITDRAVIIRMQRRRTGESVQRLRYRVAERQTEGLRADLAAWAADLASCLENAEPRLPDGLSDRQADAWEPLFAIADLAGDDWPQRARAAALALAQSDDEPSRGGQLLAAVRDALGNEHVIATATLLETINASDELPFGGWRDGRGLDARTLARLLRPYGVRAKTVRIPGDGTLKGYARDNALEDAFSRYLPEPSHPSHPSHLFDVTHKNPDEMGDVTHVTHVTAPATDVECDGKLDADAELARVVTKFGDNDKPGMARRCECETPVGRGTCAFCGREPS